MTIHAPSLLRALAVACASLALVGAAGAQGRGGPGLSGGGFHGGGFHGGPRGGFHGGHGHGGDHGWGWGGFGLGVGVGWGLGLAGTYAYPYPYGYSYPAPYPWYAPGYVVVDPTVTYVQGQPVPAAAPPAPVVYPRNGQNAQQQDADSNACSEWAGKQPNATVDPNVFQRAMGACLEGRGYTVR